MTNYVLCIKNISPVNLADSRESSHKHGPGGLCTDGLNIHALCTVESLLHLLVW